MANFQVQIEDIAGESGITSQSKLADYTATLSDFLKQSARAVLDILPDSVLIRDSIQSTITGSSGITVTDKKIVKVLRGNYGAIEIPLELKAQVQADSGSLMEPTIRNPIYYIEGQVTTGGSLFIKPDPANTDSTTKGYVHHISYPSPLYSDTTIANFPDSAEYAVVLGAAMRLLQHKMNILIHEDEDPELAQTVGQEIGIVMQMYNDKLTRLGATPTMGVTDGSE